MGECTNDAEKRLQKLIRAAIDDYPDDPISLFRDRRTNADWIRSQETRRRNRVKILRAVCLAALVLAGTLTATYYYHLEANGDLAPFKNVYEGGAQHGFAELRPNGVRPEWEGRNSHTTSFGADKEDKAREVFPGIRTSPPDGYALLGIVGTKYDDGKWAASVYYLSQSGKPLIDRQEGTF